MNWPRPGRDDTALFVEHEFASNTSSRLCKSFLYSYLRGKAMGRVNGKFSLGISTIGNFL